MAASFSLFSGFRRVDCSGWQLPERVVRRCEHCKRSFSFESLHQACGLYGSHKSGVILEFIAFWTMSFVGYIDAPPTMGFSVANSVATTFAATRAASVRFLLFILVFLFHQVRTALRPSTEFVWRFA